MNAALKLVCAYRKIGAAGSWSHFNTTSRDETYQSEVQAFGRGNRVAGNAVEFGNESAAKLSYGSKSVRLATAILDECRTSNIHLHITWLISPFVSILGLFEFFDELGKCRVAISDASTIAEHGVKSRGLAVVIEPYLLVALNGASACGKAQESDCSRHHPDHGSEITLLHAIKPPCPGRLE
jgi:hypothetical protein